MTLINLAKPKIRISGEVPKSDILVLGFKDYQEVVRGKKDIQCIRCGDNHNTVISSDYMGYVSMLCSKCQKEFYVDIK